MEHTKALEFAEAQINNLIEKMVVDGITCAEIQTIWNTAFKNKCQYAQNDEQLKKVLGVEK